MLNISAEIFTSLLSLRHLTEGSFLQFLVQIPECLKKTQIYGSSEDLLNGVAKEIIGHSLPNSAWTLNN